MALGRRGCCWHWSTALDVTSWEGLMSTYPQGCWKVPGYYAKLERCSWSCTFLLKI